MRNPVVGLETVAIAPFFNLSQERTVDGREFALDYYSELQKVPGFEVLPTLPAPQPPLLMQCRCFGISPARPRV